MMTNNGPLNICEILSSNAGLRSTLFLNFTLENSMPDELQNPSQNMDADYPDEKFAFLHTGEN